MSETRLELKSATFDTAEKLTEFVKSRWIIREDIQCILPTQTGKFVIFYWSNKWYV